MPTYEYRCLTCDTLFEERRPMSRAGEPATCPDGHEGARKLFASFAVTGAGGSSSAGAAPAAPAPPAHSGCACH